MSWEGNYSYKINQPKNIIPKYPSEWGFEIETEEFHVVKSLMIPGTNHQDLKKKIELKTNLFRM